jgi:DNA-binding NarL/FixJ family response regulator
MEISNVFLIEDDSFFATTFRKKMEGVGNFMIHHFNSCEEAIEQMNHLKPEVVFMDHVLRGTKGVDAIPDILNKEPEAHVVVISNQSDINVVDKAFTLGASKYFRKDILLLDHVEGFIRDLESEKKETWKMLFA